MSLKKFLEDSLRGRSRDKPRLRISQSGEDCIRRMYFQATGAPKEEDSSEGLIKMGLGSALDEFSLKSGQGVAIQVPVTISLGGFTLTGKADAVFEAQQMVSDLKVVGQKTWDGGWFQKGAKDAVQPKHYAQVTVYGWGLGLPNASVLYVNASTGEMVEHTWKIDEYEAEEFFGQFEQANYHLVTGTVPPRPFMDITEDDGTVKLAKERYPCGWKDKQTGERTGCAYRKHCWEDE